MSLAKIKESADAHKEDYVTVRADELAKALTDAGEKPTPGSLLEHCEQVKARTLARAKAEGTPPDQVKFPDMQVHREKHLGKLLGVPAMPLET